MRQAVEGRIAPLQHLPVPQVRRGPIGRTDVVHVLAGLKPLEELHDARVPPRHVSRQLFKYRRRSLATPIGNRIGHLGARAAGPFRHTVQRPVADQVSDVGSHPIGAGLDKLVIVELIEILSQHRNVFSQHLAQCAQDATLFGITNAIQRRKKLIDLVCFWIHCIAFS
ncbi:MAG: hypothetical protein E8D43_15595 [Nitrospira sp.]|nr:MAG: hypothetical protein E8D43_15595 [Nitrospira sp.]